MIKRQRSMQKRILHGILKCLIRTLANCQEEGTTKAPPFTLSRSLPTPSLRCWPSFYWVKLFNYCLVPSNTCRTFPPSSRRGCMALFQGRLHPQRETGTLSSSCLGSMILDSTFASTLIGITAMYQTVFLTQELLYSWGRHCLWDDEQWWEGRT